MMRSYILFVVASSVTIIGVNGWSHPSRSVLQQPQQQQQQQQHDWNIPTPSTRRDILSKAAGMALVASTMAAKPTIAAAAAAASPEVFNTANGIKYATIKKATGKGSPIDKDIVAIEYTGYLTDGTIFGTLCHYDI